MSRKGIIGRVVALCLVMAAVAGTLGLRMVYLQLAHGDDYRVTASRQTSVRYTVKASRGGIKDRSGVSLVSNSLSYQVVFRYYEWDRERQNEVIAEACRILDESGFSHYDSLPVSGGYPLEYTCDGFDSGAGKDLAEYAADVLSLDRLPSAGALLEILFDKYGIDGSLPFQQRRLIAGVRYEMAIREFSAYTPFILASDLGIDAAAHMAQMYRQLPGVTIEADSTRRYDTDRAAHILGRVGLIWREEYEQLRDEGYGLNAILGKDGAEKAFESYLRGIDGEETLVADIDGEVTQRYISLEPRPGNDCYLTLDIGLQAVAEDSLARTLEGIRAEGGDVEGGAVVVIDVNSGEVLAMASYPTYSLETFSEDYEAFLKDDPRAPLYNRATMGLYAPGSTFKLCTAAAALEEGVITPRQTITDRGIYTYYADYQPRCWIYRDSGRTHGTINVSEAIKYSCNYFFYEVGRLLGIDRLESWAHRFGLGEKTGIELEGERAGQVASPGTVEDWQGGLVLQAAIGQSAHQFTPLQIASYVATAVNGGTRYRPHLLKKVVDFSGESTVKEIAPEVVDELELSEATVEAIKEGMRGVVTDDGTASAYFRGYPIPVGGKTGSSQTTADRSAHGVFVSFAPYDEPEIAVCVVGEHAGSGGSVAPVVVDIYNEYFGLNRQEETPPAGEE